MLANQMADDSRRAVRFAVITNFDSDYEVGFQCAALPRSESHDLLEAVVNEQYCLGWGHRFLPCILQRDEMAFVCSGRHFAWAKVALFAWLFDPNSAVRAARHVFEQWLPEEAHVSLCHIRLKPSKTLRNLSNKMKSIR